MTREDERIKVLDLLEKGKVTSQDADNLLAALRPSAPTMELQEAANEPTEKPRRAHWIRIRVTELSTGKRKFSMTLPIIFMRFGIQFGKRYTENSMDSDSFEAGKEFFRKPVKGNVVDVSDPEDDEHVEISFL
jgi:hypothetical protein